MRHLPSIAIGISLLFLGPVLAFGQGGGGSLSITNYNLISQTRFSRSQTYYTYKADLLNTGSALAGVTATVTTTSPNMQVVSGQGVLHFWPVPGGSQTTSADSFTLIVDNSATVDLTTLVWSFLNPVAIPTPGQTVAVGTTVTLNGTNSTNPSGVGTLTYQWIMQSTPPNSRARISNANGVLASFVPDQEGTYTIALVVSNGSATDQAITLVSTLNSAPVANAGPNQSVSLNSTVILNGGGSSDVDGDSLTYLWSFVSRPAGSVAVLSNPTVVGPTFVADKSGTYIVQLVVNDGTVNSIPQTVTITVAGGNTPPVANAGPNQTVALGAQVQLTGAASTDVDGDKLTYSWSLITLPTGSAAVLSNAAIVNPTFVADVAGTYVAQLIVNDGKVNSTPSTVTITTNSTQAPTANAGQNQTVGVGAGVTLNGSGTDPQQLPLTYSWSLITVPPGSLATLSALNIANPTFIADLAGTYVAQLIVNDGVASSAPSTVTITTSYAPPVAYPGPNQSVPTNFVVSLDGSASFDPNHNPLTYSWTLLTRPSGSNAALQGATTAFPSFLADLAGTYVVQLIVNDGTASSNPSNVTITAGNIGIVLSPNPIILVNPTATLNINLSAPAPPGGLTVTLTSSNPSVATVPPSIFISATSDSIGARVNGGSPGTTTITASIPGITPATVVVTVPSPGAITLAGPATISLNNSGALTVTLGTPAPSNGVTVALASSDTGKVALSASSVTIPAGATTSSAVQMTAINVGTANITASAPGYTAAAPLVVNVTATISWVTQNTTISGIGKQATLTLQLSTHAPLDPANPNPWSTGLVVNLSSSNPNVATIQATGIFIWDGSSMPGIQIPVTSVGLGTTVIHASGVNVADVTTTVTVVNGLAITTASLPSGQPNVAYSTTLSATGGITPYTWSASGLPTGFSIDPASGTITGSSSVASISNVSVTVTDSTPTTHLVASQQFTLTIAAGVAITTASLPGGVSGALYSAPVAATGGTLPYSWSATGLPNGLGIDPVSGVISGTPTAVSSGNVSVTVTDSATPIHHTATSQFTLTIAPGVSITTLSLASASVGVAYSAPVNASGGTLPYSWAATGLPTGIAIDPNSGVISGNTSSGGSYTVNVTVTDSSSPTRLSATKQFTLTVTSGVTLSPSSLTVQAGNRVTLYIILATPAPAGGINFALSSSNPGVASIRSSVPLSETSVSVGVLITGVSPGSAVISVSAPGLPTVTATVTVTL